METHKWVMDLVGSTTMLILLVVGNPIDVIVLH